MGIYSYQQWTEEDILTLDKLYSNDVSNEQIAKVLGRTPRAIEHATKNLLLQQVIHKGTVPVSRKYNISMEEMYSGLVPQKYFAEPKKDAFCIVLSAMAIYILIATLGYFVIMAESGKEYPF